MVNAFERKYNIKKNRYILGISAGGGFAMNMPYVMKFDGVITGGWGGAERWASVLVGRSSCRSSGVSRSVPAKPPPYSSTQLSLLLSSIVLSLPRAAAEADMVVPWESVIHGLVQQGNFPPTVGLQMQVSTARRSPACTRQQAGTLAHVGVFGATLPPNTAC